MLTNLLVHATLLGGDKAALGVGANHGLIDHVAVKGTIISNGGLELAGLAAENTGTIRDSSASVNIRVGGIAYTGGLVAINSGSMDSPIPRSWSGLWWP